MINILLIDDNVDFAKNLMLYMNKTYEFLRVFGIATDGKEALNLLNKLSNIDIILLDLNLPKYSGINILNKLSIQQKEKYQKSIIIISGENYLMRSNELNNKMIYSIISKITPLKVICKQIEKLVIEKEKHIKQKNIKKLIINHLLLLGYDISHKGTNYLIDIIYQSILSGKEVIENLNKEIYPNLSRKYSRNICSIKISINRATSNMFYNCEEAKLKEYFTLVDVNKPTTKTIINTIINKVHEDLSFNPRLSV